MSAESGHRLVRLPNGAHGVHSLDYGETMHSSAGPVAEAEGLYVRSIGLRERLAAHAGEFVIWDVGLGAAANVLTVLRATRDVPARLRLLSFDNSTDPLRFALAHARELGYFEDHAGTVAQLLDAGSVRFENGAQSVQWDLAPGDFPLRLREPEAGAWPKPDVILYDPFSPARNPAMWTAPLFADLHQRVAGGRACVMPTYSRSTLLRVTLLLAGFWVGAGPASGVKEETTVAATDPRLLASPLGPAWLERARVSTSAEPLWDPVYRQAPLAPATWARLRAHPQFG